MVVLPDSIGAQGVVALEHRFPNASPDFKGKISEDQKRWIILPSFVKLCPSLPCSLEYFLCSMALDVIWIKGET